MPEAPTLLDILKGTKKKKKQNWGLDLEVLTGGHPPADNYD